MDGGYPFSLEGFKRLRNRRAMLKSIYQLEHRIVLYSRLVRWELLEKSLQADLDAAKEFYARAYPT